MKNVFKCACLGLTVGLLTVSGLPAKAQNPAPPSAMSTSSLTPMPLSGTVVRYYVDRSGYVSAMDLQTADGVKMVRFSPSIAQQVTTMYPVGSSASLTATSQTMHGWTRYDVAGLGADMPGPGMMMSPDMVSDLDVLRSQAFTTTGAKLMRYEGKLTGYVADPMDHTVLAIVLDGKTLVRLPAENRLVPPKNSPEGITDFLKNSDVVVYGYPEWTRYGIVSPYSDRVIATVVSVNGHSLGAFGFGRVGENRFKTLFGFSLPTLGGGSPDEINANNMGYMTYTPSTAAPGM